MSPRVKQATISRNGARAQALEALPAQGVRYNTCMIQASDDRRCNPIQSTGPVVLPGAPPM